VKTVEKIVSGGQTGVDRGALDAALSRGFPCGGYCPKGRLAEDGNIPESYPLTELNYGSYAERTLRNVLESDGTAVIYFDVLEGGTKQTVENCRDHHKPYLLIDGSQLKVARAAILIEEFVSSCHIQILNVAGPRSSKSPIAHAYTFDVITALLQT
jgi:hypothetical protein